MCPYRNGSLRTIDKSKPSACSEPNVGPITRVAVGSDTTEVYEGNFVRQQVVESIKTSSRICFGQCCIASIVDDVEEEWRELNWNIVEGNNASSEWYELHSARLSVEVCPVLVRGLR